MKNKALTALITVAIILTTFSSCKERKKDVEVEIEKESFAIYVGKDTFIEERNTYEMIPHKDKEVTVDKDKTIKEKISLIADTLSKSYFNDLKIDIFEIYTSQLSGKIANINLIEHPAFEGPGSLAPYQSWYDYFQGSYGGQNTTIILKESILQRDYKGNWIDGAVFFYQGDSIGDMDHLRLEGVKAL